MIDAKDLRIGNLFKWKGHIHHIIGIISWGEIEIHLNKTEDNKEAFICRDITELEPITLEDEWLEKFGFKNVHGTKITIKSDKEREVWVKSCAFGKIYDVKNLPSNNELINDAKNILNIYENIIQRGGTSELIENIDPEEVEIIKDLSGSEKKALKKHREHEKYYIKTDPKFIKSLKKKF